jgi:hypothetical protein
MSMLRLKQRPQLPSQLRRRLLLRLLPRRRLKRRPRRKKLRKLIRKPQRKPKRRLLRRRKLMTKSQWMLQLSRHIHLLLLMPPRTQSHKLQLSTTKLPNSMMNQNTKLPKMSTTQIQWDQ